MLLVKTKIEPSKVHGIGLFADQFIPKGTPIWEFTPGLDIKMTEDELQKLSEPSREQYVNYCYHSLVDNSYVLCFDDSRFINHSKNPNMKSADSPKNEEGMDIALRDIEKGEELTCDCREFDVNCANGEEWYT